MITRIQFVAAMAVAFILATGCSNQAEPDRGTAAAMVLRSSAFADGQPIPDKYTCHGEDVSPPLQWSGAPARTKSIALTVEDPDAPMGIFTHWIIFDVPPAANGFPENETRSGTLPDGSKQGKNSFGNIGYNGPCPPAGKTHHYLFKVYALDTVLNLDPGATKSDLFDAMKGHVLAQGEWTGTYESQ